MLLLVRAIAFPNLGKILPALLSIIGFFYWGDRPQIGTNDITTDINWSLD
ncbi:MAG: hypothetical protein ACYT04_37590 [Nostoc sp.]